jgi:hypothetical protein
MTPVYKIAIPQYIVSSEPDDKLIGKILDDEIKKHFLDQPILIRGVASSEHPDKTVNELIKIIQKLGTDRYDTDQVGDRYDNIEGKHIDLFAFSGTYSAETELMHLLVWGFYHSAIAIHERPMRIDILTIYDATQMEQVFHQYKGRDDIKDDGFVFKNPAKKREALLGVIILRP